MNQYGNKKEMHKTIYNIYTEYSNNKIDLDAPYQRGHVWITKDKEAFIDSILVDILPSPIVMNNDNSIGKYVCIDGKQRISAIVDFIENKFSVKQQDKSIYYSKIPTQMNSPLHRIFDQREKNIFDSRCIQIITYDDIDIKKQIDVFYRINRGEKLSEEEIMNVIVAHNQKISDIVHDKQILKLLNKYNGKSKSDNENLLLRIVYVLVNNNKEPFKIPRKIGALNDFYNDLTKEMLCEIGEHILKLFTNDAYGLLKHKNNNVLLAGAYFIKHSDYFDKADLMKIYSNDLSSVHPEIISSENVNNIYVEFNDLDKKHKKSLLTDQKQNKVIKVVKKQSSKSNIPQKSKSVGAKVIKSKKKQCESNNNDESEESENDPSESEDDLDVPATVKSKISKSR